METVRKLSAMRPRKALAKAIKFITCASIASIPVQPVFAQSGLMLEEIVVTARKRAESIQDTPIAITAFSGDEMGAKGFLDLADLGDAAPNFVFTSGSGIAGTSATANVFIRGVGQSDFVVTVDPGVGVYIDGVYYARTVGATLELLDIAQVEVLRGPQGTLFGRNTIGGAINVTSKQPSFEAQEGSVSLTAGQDAHYGVRGFVNIPMSDTVAARVSGMYRQRDGYVKALQYDNLDLGNDDVYALRGQLRWDLSDRVAFNFAADYTKEEDNGGPWVADYFDTYEAPFDHIFAYLANEVNNGGDLGDGDLSPCDPAAQRTNPNCYGPSQLPDDNFATNNTFRDVNGNLIKPFSDVENLGLALTATFEFDNVTLKSITSYRELNSSFVRALNHSPFLTFQNTTDVFDTEQFSQEFQLTGSSDNMNWLIGAYYFTEEGREVDTVINTINLVLDGRPNGARPNDEFIVENESLALFGQVTYDLTQDWHLTAGIRFTEEEKDGYTDADLLDGRRGHFTIDPIEESEVTPHLSLSYDISDTMLAYVSYSNGFKAGTFSTRTPVPELYLDGNGEPGQLPVAESETVDAYEIGLKSDLFSSRLRLNLAAFRTDYNDIQINGRQAPGSPNIIALNAGEARIQGFEAEVTLLATENLALRSNIGLLDAEYTDIIENETIRILEDTLMNRAPDYQIGLGLDWTIPLDSGLIRASLDWTFVDDIALDSDNLIQEGNGPIIQRTHSVQKAYDRGDLSVSYLPNSDKWELGLHVKNLSDSQYRTAIVDASQPENDPFGVSEVIYNRPREVFATFTYRF